MTEQQTRLFKMTAMEAADALYQNEIVALFADKKIKRPDKFRLVSLFVEMKLDIQRNVARFFIENQYKGLVKFINELKGGLVNGKRK